MHHQNLLGAAKHARFISTLTSLRDAWASLGGVACPLCEAPTWRCTVSYSGESDAAGFAGLPEQEIYVCAVGGGGFCIACDVVESSAKLLVCSIPSRKIYSRGGCRGHNRIVDPPKDTPFGSNSGGAVYPEDPGTQALNGHNC